MRFAHREPDHGSLLVGSRHTMRTTRDPCPLRPQELSALLTVSEMSNANALQVMVLSIVAGFACSCPFIVEAHFVATEFWSEGLDPVQVTYWGLPRLGEVPDGIIRWNPFQVIALSPRVGRSFCSENAKLVPERWASRWW